MSIVFLMFTSHLTNSFALLCFMIFSTLLRPYTALSKNIPAGLYRWNRKSHHNQKRKNVNIRTHPRTHTHPHNRRPIHSSTIVSFPVAQFIEFTFFSSTQRCTQTTDTHLILYKKEGGVLNFYCSIFTFGHAKVAFYTAL